LILIACLCNPIIINTFVVFVRLYWFEKRFQGVAKQAREFRRARTRSRSKSEDVHDPNFGREERGVGGREIKVLHSETDHPADENKDGVVDGAAEKMSRSSDSETTTPQNGAAKTGEADEGKKGDAISPSTQFPAFHRDITFADEVPHPARATKDETPRNNSIPRNDSIPSNGSIPNEERTPEQRAKEEHIAFVENQRNPKDRAALWIPGPRDVERGYAPQRVEEGEGDDEIGREISHEGGRPTPGDTNSPAIHFDEDAQPVRERVRATLNKLKFGSPDENDDTPTGLRARVASRSRTFKTYLSHDRETTDPLPYLSYAATIGRNSTFVDLTEEQREELGGIEYRSLKTLAWVLIAYYFGFFIFGIVILVPWIVRDKHYSELVRASGVSPTWWGFFTPMSMFTDLGFTLTPDSMVSFQTAVLPLLLGSFLIIIGNTGFPCMLRFVIWVGSKCVPHGSGVWEEFRFLLDHPRRCFTLLFPKKATWWLFGVLVLLNALDLIFFVLLDLKDPIVTSLAPGIQFLDGLFQAASTRTAGFAVVNLGELHPGIQVSYLIMMYISVFPIAISVRQTNVYEEKSLGIYGGSHDGEDTLDPNSTSYLGSHLRRQLSFDLWYVFLGLFLICCIEGSRIENRNDYAFTIFSILFEIVSAYGTVGLSLGYPTVNASFSSQFHTLSKLIIIAMMLRGRHRGLPYALDRAILLPSESLQRKEAEMDERQRARRASLASLRQHDALPTDTLSPVGPALGQLPPGLSMSRMTTVGMRRASVSTQDGPEHRRPRSVSRGGLKRIVTGALSAGPTKKTHKRA
jgi:Trk-type K+ transport system membrane component